jgi:hypothetical protein
MSSTTTPDKADAAWVGTLDGMRSAAQAVPIRAVLLTAASRLALFLLTAVSLALLIGVLRPGATPEPGPAQGRDESRAVESGTSGTSLARVLEALDATLVHPEERVQSLTTAGRQGRAVDVRLVVTTRDGASSDIGRLTARLDAAGLHDARVRSIVPVPGGARVEVVAAIAVTTVPIPAPTPIGADRVPGALTALVGSTGASLVRLDMPASSGEAVRLIIRGARADLIAILAVIEERYSSPLRIDDVRFEGAPDGTSELAVTFRLRGDVEIREGGA